MYGSWYMEHDWENFFVILDYFLPFYPTNNPKNRNFEKMKNPPGDIIILHKCTKNNDHILYCSWDMAVTDVICFSFWAILLPFYLPPPSHSLTAQKIKIFQKMKKTSGDIIILHMCTKNYDQIMHISWNMVYDERMEKVTYRSWCPI